MRRPNRRTINKATLEQYVEERTRELSNRWGLESRNGWAQVDGAGEEANRAYGEYEALNSLAEKFGLWSG